MAELPSAIRPSLRNALASRAGGRGIMRGMRVPPCPSFVYSAPALGIFAGNRRERCALPRGSRLSFRLQALVVKIIRLSPAVMPVPYGVLG